MITSGTSPNRLITTATRNEETEMGRDFDHYLGSWFYFYGDIQAEPMGRTIAAMDKEVAEVICDDRRVLCDVIVELSFLLEFDQYHPVIAKAGVELDRLWRKGEK